MVTETEILNRISNLVGDESFVYDKKSENWYSYNDLWNRAFSISQVLTSLSQVAVVMDNSFELFSMYFACMLANVTIIPIDPLKSQKEIDKIICEHTGILVIKDALQLVDKTSTEIDIKQIQERIFNIDLNKPYMITYTSGSTGHAKGVVHNLKNLFFTSIDFGNATGLNGSYTMCHVMPMTYMAGILNTIFLPFYFGCKIVLLPRFSVISAVSFWKDVRKLSINSFWLSPTMLNILMTVDRKANVKDYLSQAKTLFFIGTAPLFENIRDKFEEKYGVKLLQSYGLSETLLISTETPTGKNDSSSVGTILPSAKITIYDNEEIGIDVPWMFLKYSNEDTEQYFRNSEYMSGDLGKIVENKLYITGRKKDLIVKGGMNISPKQIEDCIVKLGYIKECAVAGIVISDEENIVCWYVSENEIPKNDVNSFIEANVGRHCRIDVFMKVTEIPKNLNGKPDKRSLIEGFEK